MAIRRHLRRSCRDLYSSMARTHASLPVIDTARWEGRQIASLRETVAQLREVVAQLRSINSRLLVLHDDLELDRGFAERQMVRYQTLFDTAPDAYLVTDADGVIIDVNGVAQHVLREDAHRLTGTPLSRLLRRTDGCPIDATLADLRTCDPSHRWLLDVVVRGDTDSRATASVAAGMTASGDTELRWILHPDGACPPAVAEPSRGARWHA